MSSPDMNMNDNNAEAVAVIGMDGRFPGAADVGEYWENLLAGRETLERFSRDEIDHSVARHLRDDDDYVPVRGRMPEADRFDAEFFGISLREAEVLDPQQRVFLEMCWRALEDAGYAPGTHELLTGVFAGMSNNTYFNAHVAAHPDVLASYGDLAAMIANEKDYLTTRVAYKLNLRGPCINITTACSTSLVAVCHAFNSLLDYQCDIALAGGVAISCPQERGYLYQEGSIHSPDGHCRPFDADAKGTVFSNGGGVVLLKRLQDAIADGDTIHAVLRGAAMNNDGAGKVSFTAPGVDGQAQVISMAQEIADVDPETIGYVEAHGTGTTLGDPIEVSALTQAFRDRTSKTAYCRLGSVKGNIGHLDAASGIAGLIKAVLALRERRLPPTLHFSTPNPALDIENTPFRIVDRVTEWEQETPRRAAVSSFGLGGTNAHVILEEAPVLEASDHDDRAQLLVLSARTPAALDRARESLGDFLEANPSLSLADAAFTLQQGRVPMAERLAVVAGSTAEAGRLLAANDPAGLRCGAADESPRDQVFMFPGQGSQRIGMAESLYQQEALVREIIDDCADALRDVLEFDLRDVMFGNVDNADELLDETRYTQPALFAIEYALARLWMKWGMTPSLLVGHSIGEFTAAALAGVFTLEDAVRVVAERGRLMQEQAQGSMLSVRLSPDSLEPQLLDGLCIAAVNAPELCVVSGEDAVVHRLQQRLEKSGVTCSLLRTSHAFHSAMMDPAVGAFERFLGGVRLSAPRLDIVSTATGEMLAAEQAMDPAYWAAQLREPVRFMTALETAAARVGQQAVFLEVGPGSAASTFALQTLDGEDVEIMNSLGRGKQGDEYRALLTTAGRLWTHGVEIDWNGVHDGYRRRRIPLPTYRFERARHWLDSRPAEDKPAIAASARPASVEADREVAAKKTETPSTRAELEALLSSISGIESDRIKGDTPFAELGLDSLLLTQFSQALRRKFGVKLKFRELLVKHNTLDALVGLIGEENGEAAAIEATPKAAEKPRQPQPAPGATGVTLTEQQRHYVEDLCRRYTWRTSGSKAFVRTHRAHLADPRTVAGFDPMLKEMVYPLVAESASGARIQDTDGNSYIDLVNGFGANLLGHSPACVNEAVRAELRKGYALGPQTPLAGRVARLVQALTHNERVTFCTSGSEAVQAALRVARTVTGRDRIVMFDGDYHGIFDEVLARRLPNGAVQAAAPGIPRSLLANVEILEYGKPESIERIRELGDSLAAVLVEPVQDRHPEKYSATFLENLRDATHAVGSALVFDEMVTGFRVHPGGMQALNGVKADLTVYAKAVGGGLPLGILAGSAQYMDALDGGDWQYGDDSAPQSEMTFLAGTHVRHPLVLAAAEATLLHLQEAGQRLQDGLESRTARLVSKLEAHCRETGAPISFRRFHSWFAIDIDSAVPLANLLYCRLRAGGVHACEGRLCFLSTAHTDADIAQVARVFREAIDELGRAGFFDDMRPPESEARPVAARATGTDPASPPQPGARLGRRPDGQPGWFIPDPDRPGRYRELRTR